MEKFLDSKRKRFVKYEVWPTLLAAMDNSLSLWLTFEKILAIYLHGTEGGGEYPGGFRCAITGEMYIMCDNTLLESTSFGIPLTEDQIKKNLSKLVKKELIKVQRVGFPSKRFVSVNLNKIDKIFEESGRIGEVV